MVSPLPALSLKISCQAWLHLEPGQGPFSVPTWRLSTQLWPQIVAYLLPVGALLHCFPPRAVEPGRHRN